MKIKNKIWLKCFTGKQFESIQEIFKKNSPYKEESWGKNNLPKMLKKSLLLQKERP